MKPIANQLLRLAKQILSARPWEEKIVGNNIRLQYNWSELLLEEVPAKGKRKLRKFTMYILPWVSQNARAFGFPNIVREAGINKSMTYDAAKRALETTFKAMAKDVHEESSQAGGSVDPMQGSGMSESQVHYLKFTPEDAKPFTAEGRDFSISVKWTEFSAYSPDSDFQQADPYYTEYASKSPTAARKMYKILKANPTALKGVSWNDFGKWMDRNKVKYDINFSVWR